MMRSFFFGGLLALSACYCQAGVITLEQNEEGVTVKVDGKPFTNYLIKAGPKPYLWPVVGPNGVEMTRAYPMKEVDGEKKDHPHHRSFWFTHGNVNGVDFWAETKGHGDIKHKEFLKVNSGPPATLTTVNEWIGPDGKKHLEDTRTLTFSANDKSRTIDFDITLQATNGEVVFNDTKEGSFGLRIPTVMDVTSKQGGKILNSEGQTDAEAWGKPAKWVDYTGTLNDKPVGIAILNHPSSFRYPTHWHVRTYGLFAANPFGLKDFKTGQDGAHTLKEGDSISLRYRVIFHLGNTEDAQLQKSFEQYSAEKK